MKELLLKFADDFVVLLASLLGTIIRSKLTKSNRSLQLPK